MTSSVKPPLKYLLITKVD